ncbi:hypothetical protein V2J09_016349 [Rumex salicifolius]
MDNLKMESREVSRSSKRVGEDCVRISVLPLRFENEESIALLTSHGGLHGLLTTQEKKKDVSLCLSCMDDEEKSIFHNFK